jgi:phosphoribosylformylglycinamidine (FGAM) synthase-like enzyme
VLGILGLIEDADKALGSGFRQEGDLIFLLDAADVPESASIQRPSRCPSQGIFVVRIRQDNPRIVAGAPPAIDLPAEKRLIGCMVKLAAEKAIVSAHDVSDGGIAVALAESCFAADGLSAEIRLTGKDEPTEIALFGERGGRAVISAGAEFYCPRE